MSDKAEQPQEQATEIVESPAPDTPAIPGQDNSIMALLSECAKDPNFDANKLELLIGLKERVDATEAKKAFIDAMFDFHLNPPRIVKDTSVYGKDKQTNPDAEAHYQFAKFEKTVNLVRPALRAVGIIATWESEDLGNNVTNVTCVLRHKLGHEERASMSGLPEAGGSKNAIQGIGSSSSYLRRYTYMLVTGLVAEGEDDDAGGVKEWTGPIKKAAIKKLAQKFHTAIGKCLTSEDVNTLVKDSQAMLDQIAEDLPDWYAGNENSGGLQGAIADKLESITAVTGE